MTGKITRRGVLAGITALAAGEAWANAPLTSIRPQPRGDGTPPLPAPPPANALIDSAGLGGAVGYLAVNAATGEVIDAYNPMLRLPPASVAKAATAFFALSRLGAGHRFRTTLEAAGPVESGRLLGDLILRGGGDPTLDTDTMGAMAAALKEQGIFEVTGQLRVDGSALPAIPHIDPDQPDHVGYNPSISGLNLNFNRVHFEWKRGGSDYDITMQARGLRFRPSVRVARMALSDRKAPIYSYEDRGGVDRWTVARRALGQGGARWLPVRRPEAYAAEAFASIARSHGIELTVGEPVDGLAGTALVTSESDPLAPMLEGMLRYSTNLTAEVVGLAAAQADGDSPASLISSAREMNLWFNRALGCKSAGFVDHSGLGYGSRISARDMVEILSAARRAGTLPGLLKPFRTDLDDTPVLAKTGTLNFVSTLAGYVEPPGRDPITFAVFTADMPRRDAIPVDQRERPPGARGWSSRSRTLQRKLIARWVSLVST